MIAVEEAKYYKNHKDEYQSKKIDSTSYAKSECLKNQIFKRAIYDRKYDYVSDIANELVETENFDKLKALTKDYKKRFGCGYNVTSDLHLLALLYFSKLYEDGENNFQLNFNFSYCSVGYEPISYNFIKSDAFKVLHLNFDKMPEHL
ncbi:MAG: hypothetical protein A2Y17_04870 [Clostridiales bacterium GWF2_38_85]|nr:MAG: hypothetical protein A2Y17_04870 [Clostridiales bacterium GWF2_38_85]HBL84380.1 hypothetical protein [Clostridiales bacterium]